MHVNLDAKVTKKFTSSLSSMPLTVFCWRKVSWRSRTIYIMFVGSYLTKKLVQLATPIHILTHCIQNSSSISNGAWRLGYKVAIPINRLGWAFGSLLDVQEGRILEALMILQASLSDALCNDASQHTWLNNERSGCRCTTPSSFLWSGCRQSYP